MRESRWLLSASKPSARMTLSASLVTLLVCAALPDWHVRAAAAGLMPLMLFAPPLLLLVRDMRESVLPFPLGSIWFALGLLSGGGALIAIAVAWASAADWALSSAIFCLVGVAYIGLCVKGLHGTLFLFALYLPLDDIAWSADGPASILRGDFEPIPALGFLVLYSTIGATGVFSADLRKRRRSRIWCGLFLAPILVLPVLDFGTFRIFLGNYLVFALPVFHAIDNVRAFVVLPFSNDGSPQAGILYSIRQAMQSGRRSGPLIGILIGNSDDTQWLHLPPGAGGHGQSSHRSAAVSNLRIGLGPPFAPSKSFRLDFDRISHKFFAIIIAMVVLTFLRALDDVDSNLGLALALAVVWELLERHVAYLERAREVFGTRAKQIDEFRLLPAWGGIDGGRRLLPSAILWPVALDGVLLALALALVCLDLDVSLPVATPALVALVHTLSLLAILYAGLADDSRLDWPSKPIAFGLCVYAAAFGFAWNGGTGHVPIAIMMAVLPAIACIVFLHLHARRSASTSFG